MKLLLLGILPVIIFWLVEERFGTTWGLIAAVVWAIGECLYEYIKYRRIESLTLVSTGLVVVLGGLGALLDQSFLFKFQPVIMDVVLAGILLVGSRSEDPFLLKMARKTRPDAFLNAHPEVIQHQRNLMKKLTLHLIGLLLLHAALLSYCALKRSTRDWALMKTVGFYVIFLVWMGVEFLYLKARNFKNSKE